MYFSPNFFLSDPDEMWHFISVFTVSESTLLNVSSKQIKGKHQNICPCHD